MSSFCYQVYLNNNLYPIHVEGDCVQTVVEKLKKEFGNTDNVNTILKLGRML